MKSKVSTAKPYFRTARFFLLIIKTCYHALTIRFFPSKPRACAYPEGTLHRQNCHEHLDIL